MNALRRLRRSPAFVAGATLFALILLAALLAPALAPYPPNAQNLTGGLLPPSPEPDPVTRATDFVAGMTDRYALRAYAEAFMPREGPL